MKNLITKKAKKIINQDFNNIDFLELQKELIETAAVTGITAGSSELIENIFLTKEKKKIYLFKYLRNGYFTL